MLHLEKNAGGSLDLTAPLDCGGSGTTIRLMAGLLAGQPFTTILAANSQLVRRPMQRIIDPLCRMGADISSLTRPESQPTNGRNPMLVIRGGGLHAISYQTPVASAQIKSAILSRSRGRLI